MQQVLRIKYGQKDSKSEDYFSEKQADIRVLGDSLVGLANSIERANIIAGNSESKLSFHIGCYEHGSDIFEIAVSTAVGCIPLLQNTLGLYDILKEVGFFEDGSMNLINFFRWKEDNPVHEVIQKNHEGVLIKADNGAQVNIGTFIYKMASDKNLAKSLEQAVRNPLYNGVDQISFEKEEEGSMLMGNSFDKKSLPILSPLVGVQEDLSPNIVKRWLTITRPDLDKGTDFYFKDDHEGKDKKIIIEDEVFVEKVLKGKKFRHGDCIFVVINETQSFTKNGQLKTKMIIEQVLDFKSSYSMPLPIE